MCTRLLNARCFKSGKCNPQNENCKYTNLKINFKLGGEAGVCVMAEFLLYVLLEHSKIMRVSLVKEGDH